MTLSIITRMGVGLGVFVILARSLGPKDFGLISATFAYAGLAGLLSDFGLSTRLLRDFAADPTRSAAALAEGLVIKSVMATAFAGLGIAALAIMGMSAESLAACTLFGIGVLLGSVGDLSMVSYRAAGRYRGEAVIVGWTSGLYAMLIVEESNPLPGLGDLAIVVDDWKLEDGGAIAGDFGDIETMVGEGRLGNWFTVNNRYRPKLPLKPGQFTRLRLLNAANVRTMGLLFKGYDPLVIARDGQPIAPQPLGQKALMLAPGQRADLLVSPEEGDIRIALDLFEDIVEIAYLISEGTEKPPAIADNFALAPNPITPLPVVTDARAIGLRIEGGIKGGLKSARFQGVERDLRSLLENGKGWALNGVAGPAAEPLFTATLGEVILLEVDNRTAFSQALHIHGHVWQEIDDNLSGHWQDTAIIAAGERVTLAFVAGNPGTWAIQSLVAERADGGMIGAFTVVDG